MNRPATTLSLLVLAVLAVTDCQANRLPTLSPSASQCYADVFNCSLMFNATRYEVDNRQELVQQLADRELLLQMSAEATRASTCQQAVEAGLDCQNVSFSGQYQYRYIPVMAEFLATPGAIDALVDFSSSECLGSPDRDVQVSVMSTICGGQVEQAIVLGGDVCAALNGAVQCIRQGATSICGASAGEMVQVVWDFFTAPGHSQYMDFLVNLGMDLSPCERQVVVARRFSRDVIQRFRK